MSALTMSITFQSNRKKREELSTNKAPNTIYYCISHPSYNLRRHKKHSRNRVHIIEWIQITIIVKFSRNSSFFVFLLNDKRHYKLFDALTNAENCSLSLFASSHLSNSNSTYYFRLVTQQSITLFLIWFRRRKKKILSPIVSLSIGRRVAQKCFTKPHFLIRPTWQTLATQCGYKPSRLIDAPFSWAIHLATQELAAQLGSNKEQSDKVWHLPWTTEKRSDGEISHFIQHS